MRKIVVCLVAALAFSVSFVLAFGVPHAWAGAEDPVFEVRLTADEVAWPTLDAAERVEIVALVDPPPESGLAPLPLSLDQVRAFEALQASRWTSRPRAVGLQRAPLAT